MKLTAELGNYKLYEEALSDPPLGRINVEVRVAGDENKEEVVYRFPKPIFEKSHRFTASPITSEKYPLHEQWQRKNVLYRPTDIVVATYPKCGTTFAEQIVLLLLNDGEVDKLDPSTQNALQASDTGIGKIWAETCVVPNDFVLPEKYAGRKIASAFQPVPIDRFDALPDPRVLKSHGSSKTVLSTDSNGNLAPAKYLVVTRNMFDACVSSYYHAWSPARKGWPFEAWALVWLHYGWDTYGEYFDWHMGWHGFKERYPPRDGAVVADQPEVLWMHYEDMIQAPREGIERIARFLGVESSTDLIDKVVEGSSFKKMKTMADENKHGKGHLGKDGFRKGEAGGWKDYFTPELEEYFRKKYEETLRPLGIKFRIGDGEILE